MFLPPSNPPTPSPTPPWAGTTRRPLKERIVEALRYLSDEIESRRVGGLGEAQAAGYLAGRLRRADYAAAVLSFRAGLGEKTPLALLTALGALCGGVAAASTGRLWIVVACLLLLAVVALLLAEVEGPEPLRHLLQGTTSQSVVAGRAASSKKADFRVVVVAPLDGPPRPVLSRQGLLLLLSLLVVEGVGMGVLLFSDALGWRVLVASCAVLLVLLGGWISIRPIMPRPLPAIYGAGELATLLMIAEELEPLQNVEVWVVALGGSTIGHESIRAMIERYPFSPADSYFINLHQIGAGQPVFVTREGVLRERRSDRVLLAYAADTDAADITIDAEPRRLRERTLAQSLLRQGFRTISISSHSAGSLFTTPEPDTIERCVRLVVGLIHRLREGVHLP